MKKALVLILCLLTVFTVSCNNDNASTEKAQDSETVLAQGTGKSETDAITEDVTSFETDAGSEAATSEETGTLSFDTSWASNEFEALLPELPFKGWRIKSETDKTIQLEKGDLKTVWNPTDPDDPEGIDKVKLIKYLESLPKYGFTVKETNENYAWLVTDAKGNIIEFTCADGFCWVTIKKAN